MSRAVATTAAVIGAGAVGLAVALELRRVGVDVTVIERAGAPALGSSGRANGGVRAQFSSAANILFSQHTIRALAELDASSGGLVGYRPIGYLFMAAGDAAAASLNAACALQRSLGVPVELIGSGRLRDLAPFVRCDDVQAATFCGSDGVVDPHGVCAALWRAGSALGAHYLFDAEVRRLERSGERAIVGCDDIRIAADHVINAAGPEAAEVAGLAGLDLPVQPYRRNLACTQPVTEIPRVIPMCVDLDTGLLVRREGEGILLAYSDPHSPPTPDTSFDPEFLEAVAARIGKRFPVLAEAAIDPRKCWAGSYPETPDHNAIIDAPHDAPWFIQCAGFGGHGIMHCLAAGRAVAELVRDGACSSFDLRPLSLARFQDGAAVPETAVL